MDKLEYLAKTLSRTRRKDYENYVVNAVWNRLDDDSLKPVSQQWLARRDGKGYFIDLYFPQVSVGVECDEPYHKAQEAKDIARELDLIDILNAIDGEHGYVAKHVDVTRGYEGVEDQIREAVEAIRAEARRRRATGEFAEWKPERRPADVFREAGSISVSDGVAFPTIREACNALFATGYEHNLQRCYFTPRGPFQEQFGGRYKAWFPARVTPDGRGQAGWLNVVSRDGSELYEGREGQDYEGDGDDSRRMTFIRARDPITGVSGYRFLGIFEPDGTKDVDGRVHRRYRRVSESFPVLVAGA